MNFSVIIPLYNKEKHIKKAVESVLQQTYQSFEIIIVDDGSTDLGVEKVRKLLDPRIKLIKKENEGVSSARNAGINRASYNYIGLLDADDCWKPTFLESIYNLINQYPNAGAYATSYEFIGKGTDAKSAKFNVDLDKGQGGVVDYFKGALKDPLISASSVVIPKHVFKSVGTFSLELTKGEDLDMWCRIALQYNIVFLNKVSSGYFFNAENRSSTSETVYSNAFMSRVEQILKDEQQKGNTSLYFEEYMISRIMVKARYLIKSNRTKEARVLLNKYKHTKFNKKIWLKTYLLSFKLFKVANNIKRRLKR